MPTQIAPHAPQIILGRSDDSGPNAEHFARMVARVLAHAGLWDGISPITIHQPFELSRRIFGPEQADPFTLRSGQDYEIQTRVVRSPLAPKPEDTRAILRTLAEGPTSGIQSHELYRRSGLAHVYNGWAWFNRAIHEAFKQDLVATWTKPDGSARAPKAGLGYRITDAGRAYLTPASDIAAGESPADPTLQTPITPRKEETLPRRERHYSPWKRGISCAPSLF